MILKKKDNIILTPHPGECDRLLDALGMPRCLPAIPEKDLLDAMTLDKKSAGKQLRVIMLDRIGVCRIVPTDVDFFQGMTTQKFVQN